MIGQRSIKLNCMQFIGMWQKMAGQGASSGSDLNQTGRVLTACSGCQLFQYRIANKKMLP